MSSKIGVIAEDVSDIDTLYELTCQLCDENLFQFKKFVGHGCSKIRRKGRAWAENLNTKGCEFLVVVHDLDENNKQELRDELEQLTSGLGFSSHLVLIPVRELEAWLLCDRNALKTVFHTKKCPGVPANPELVIDPKKELKNTIKASGGPTYLNTIHNKRIAREAKITVIAKKCPSFRPYVSFIKSVVS